MSFRKTAKREFGAIHGDDPIPAKSVKNPGASGRYVLVKRNGSSTGGEIVPGGRLGHFIVVGDRNSAVHGGSLERVAEMNQAINVVGVEVATGVAAYGSPGMRALPAGPSTYFGDPGHDPQPFLVLLENLQRRLQSTTPEITPGIALTDIADRTARLFQQPLHALGAVFNCMAWGFDETETPPVRSLRPKVRTIGPAAHTAAPEPTLGALLLQIPADGSEELTSLLNQVCSAFLAGRKVRVVVDDQDDAGGDLTSQQVADLLNVSRPHVTKLAKTGKLPHHMVGTHHRFKADDVERYMAAVRSDRTEALTSLVPEGGYRDEDF